MSKFTVRRLLSVAVVIYNRPCRSTVTSFILIISVHLNGKSRDAYIALLILNTKIMLL